MNILLLILIMNFCMNCNIAIHVSHQYFYDVTDMEPDFVSIIEQWTAREVASGDLLCQECFDLLIIEADNINEGNIGERRFGHQAVCACCGISLSMRTGRQRRSLQNDTPERAYIENIISPRQIPPTQALVCNACWQRAHYHTREIRQPEPIIDVQEQLVASTSGSSSIVEPLSTHASDAGSQVLENTSLILEGYSRTPDTANHCFVPDCDNAERRRVPIYLKKKILMDHKIFITNNARVCDTHLSLYNYDFLDEYEFMTQFTSLHIVKMLDLLRKKINESIDFEKVESMNDTVCKYWTGLTVIHFLAVLNIIITDLGNICRKPKTALGLYMLRLRTGEPLRRIASLFCMSPASISFYIKKARNCLKEHYVPLHLGINHITRESLSSRNLLIPRGLFGTDENNPIIICDGTYLYLQKSSNYLFQKKSYSLHKFGNLLKPFMIVATDGHIIDIFGPYAATTSDAEIMQMLFANGSPLRNYFQENDVFLLDRGFRDAISLLNSLGYNVYKPEGLHEGESQLSTVRANMSRLVTLCRWVVEVVNGRFKRDFKIFRNKYFNLAVKTMIDDFRICGAIINNFHPCITDRPDAEVLVNRALEKFNLENLLADHVITHNLNRRRATFVSINGDLPALNMFPVMTMSDLILFSLGTYQIKQARSYYGEHIRTSGTFAVEISSDLNITNVRGISSSGDTVLIRGRIRSRHQSNRIYYTYILLNPSQNNWEEIICGYYCSCYIGRRTVGSCAHLMTIVWYLGWARHQENITPPAQFLDSVIVREDVENEIVNE